MSTNLPNAEYAPEDCHWCNSTGKDRDQSTIPPGYTFRPCAVCKGQGSVLVAQPARICQSCQGQGEDIVPVHGKTTPRCLSCKGSGWAHHTLIDRG